MNSFPSLCESISMIRTRHGKNMAEFGKMVGVTSATISRWESGQIVPTGAALRILLGLAEGLEKKPLLDALGAAAADPQEIAGELAQGRFSGKPGLKAFAKVAQEILEREEDVPPYLSDLLKDWLRLSGSANAHPEDKFLQIARDFLSSASTDELHEVQSLMVTTRSSVKQKRKLADVG